MALVLAVVLLSAAIRLGQTKPPLSEGMLLLLRGFHRAAASLEVLVAAWLGWWAWRMRAERPALARGVALAGGLTVALSALGIVAGRSPPPAAAMGNLLGGLALAAVFAWLLAEIRSPGSRSPGRSVRLWAPLLAAQCVLGAWLAVSAGPGFSPALPVHAILGILLAAGGIRLSSRSSRRAHRGAGIALALLVPIAGLTALQAGDSPAAAFAHAAAAALLVCAAAYSRLRPT
ncbi:MAG: hypothetical protein IT513_01435 [Burkholderiales bacterium]|nr:hypothetical protein [Burkholderiales bacterium]